MLLLLGASAVDAGRCCAWCLGVVLGWQCLVVLLLFSRCCSCQPVGMSIAAAAAVSHQQVYMLRVCACCYLVPCSSHDTTHAPRHLCVNAQVVVSQSMWTAGGAWPLLPWSCVVMEAVAEEELAALQTRDKGAVAAGSSKAATGSAESASDSYRERVRVVHEADSVT